MQYFLGINQVKALEWELNASEAIVFSVLHGVSNWAEFEIVDNEPWYWVSNQKVADELPFLGIKSDTVKRIMKSLSDKEIIERKVISGRSFIQVTAKGKEWNKTTAEQLNGREKNPDLKPKVGKKIPSRSGKKSLAGREKNPAYHINHNHNNHEPKSIGASMDAPTDEPRPKNDYPDEFEAVWRVYPKRAGSNPKRRAFQSWNARIKSGVTASQIYEGVLRYQKYCLATEKTETEFVMQSATFFGKDEHYLNDWIVPVQRQASRSGGSALAWDDTSWMEGMNDEPF